MAKPTEENSTDDLARQGRTLFEERVRPNMDEDAQRGKFVAIDTETGDFEIGPDKLGVMDRLEEREPKARGHIWLTRVRAGARRALRRPPARSRAGR